MTFISFIFRFIAGAIAFEYGYHSNDLDVLGLGWQWTIGLAIWFIFYFCLDMAVRTND